MAYTPGNLQLMTQAQPAGARQWFYSSADPVGDVDASGYFTDGFEKGMVVGDSVIVYDTNLNLATACFVSAVNSTTGVATITEMSN